MGQHTPGPWMPDGYSIRNPEGLRLGQMFPGGTDGTQATANAVLAAAAPEMYNALKALVANLIDETTNDIRIKMPAWNASCHALAKAEGRTEQ